MRKRSVTKQRLIHKDDDEQLLKMHLLRENVAHLAMNLIRVKGSRWLVCDLCSWLPQVFIFSSN